MGGVTELAPGRGCRGTVMVEVEGPGPRMNVDHLRCGVIGVGRGLGGGGVC